MCFCSSSSRSGGTGGAGGGRVGFHPAGFPPMWLADKQSNFVFKPSQTSSYAHNPPPPFFLFYLATVFRASRRERRQKNYLMGAASAQQKRKRSYATVDRKQGDDVKYAAPDQFHNKELKLDAFRFKAGLTGKKRKKKKNGIQITCGA